VPPGVNSKAVNKYIYLYLYISLTQHQRACSLYFSNTVYLGIQTMKLLFRKIFIHPHYFRQSGWRSHYCD